MKIGILLALVLFTVHSSKGQQLPNFLTIRLDTNSDYDSVANRAALQAANYILSLPIPKGRDLSDRLYATRYLLKWIAGTPDFNFNVDSSIEKIATENDDLVRVFLAAMVKFTMENAQAAKNLNMQKLEAFKIVLMYCKNNKNNVLVSGELKKMMDANDNGKLNEYLNL